MLVALVVVVVKVLVTVFLLLMVVLAVVVVVAHGCLLRLTSERERGTKKSKLESQTLS